MISLCMIARDEERFLERCLSSVGDIVDEIILIDTGSVDRTKEIAVSFGARVHDYKWRDNFAAARNFAISKATGSWLFSLDADEVIAGGDGRTIQNLAAGRPPAMAAFSFVTRNYTRNTNLVGWVPNGCEYGDEQAGTGWVPTEKIRLFPNQPGIRYEDPVHEMVEPSIQRSGIEIRKCSVPIHHYGSLDQDTNHRKMLSYYQLGRKKAGSTQNRSAALYELAIQAGILGKMKEAVELWEAFITLRPNVPEAYVHLGTAYFQCAHYEAASKAAATALRLAPEMREARYNYCIAEFILGNIAEAQAGLELLINTSPDFQPACLVMAAVNLCSGNDESGFNEIERLKQTDFAVHLEPTITELAYRLKRSNQPKWADILSSIITEKKRQDRKI